MSEYAPITGELRNWFEHAYSYDVGETPWFGWKNTIEQMLDAIDSVHAALEAEHEKAMIRAGQLLDDAEKERDYNYANWQECKQKVLQGNITFDELNARIEHLMDELSHCIELPKDADGEHIHIGDVMECEKLPNGNRVCGEVKAIGNGYVWLMNVQYKIRAEYLHHYHAPTVEDVLKEMHGKLYEADRKFLSGKVTTRKYSDELAQTIDEYAAKLRLAGDYE